MYDLETLGIPSIDISHPDEEAIKEFKKGINLKEGRYHADIHWKPGLLDKVPHNLGICKQIPRTVSERNGDLDDKYLDVFRDHERLGIIKRLPNEFNPNNYKFIPHRPVICNDPLVNFTKIRPVFNCSLRLNLPFH